jgi:thiol-disulfide isomerase/thioredoxin
VACENPSLDRKQPSSLSEARGVARIAVTSMKKSLLFFIISITCLGALRYFRPDFSWFEEAFAEDSSNIADMNQPMPHAVLPAVDQGWVDMESYKGKVVLISFWTTWCPGCRDEMPELIKLQQKFESKGFTVVAVSVDDQGEESVETFVQTEHFPVDGSSAAINFPVLLGNEEIAQNLGFEGGLPASVLVTRDAKEVKIIRGPFNAQEVSKAIKHLL